MNKKLLALSAAILMVLTLIIVPGFGLLPPYPPEPAEPEIAVKIDGTWLHTLPPPFEPDFAYPDWEYCDNLPDTEEEGVAGMYAPFELEAPQFCNTFDVEIWFLNVTKLYGYDFRLIWNYGFLDLESYSLIDLGEGMGEQHVIDGDPFTDGMQPMFVQVWGHLGAVEGFSGSAKVADLVFHVHQDPVYPGAFYSLIYILSVEASGPTTNPIELGTKHGVVKLVSIEPEMSLTPEDLIIVWEQDKQITFKVNVEDVIKMKSFCLFFEWNLTIFGEDPHPTQLILDPQKHPVVVTDFLPGPYETYVVNVEETSVFIYVKRDCEKPPINGTGVIVEITLTAISPWNYKTTSIPELCYEKERKVVPPYTFYDDECDEPIHLWLPDECHDLVNASLCIDGLNCTQPATHYDEDQDRAMAYMGLYVLDPITPVIWGSPWSVDPYYMDLGMLSTFYDFRPISGDFDMSGHVGLEDLMAIIEWYGAPDSLAADLMAAGLSPTEAATRAAEIWANCLSDFDIVSDDTPDEPGYESYGEIDIFDLTAVAKQFCSDVPFYWPWEEPYLDP